MPIWLVTGAPGSGKTHFVMKKIKEELKQGRKVYTNIAECKLEGIEPIPTNDKGELDWTLTPQGNADTNEKGALIVYDEAQKLPYFEYKKGEKLSANHLLKDLENHRHKGYDVIFITQSPKFLHLHLFELINEHYHVNRRFNRNQSEICLYRNKCEMNPTTQAAYARAEDIFTVDYDKKLFEQYKSTEIVTNKGFRMSRKLRNSLIITGLIFSALFYYIFFKDNKYLKSAVGIEQSEQAKGKATHQTPSASSAKPSEQANPTLNAPSPSQAVNVEHIRQAIEQEIRQKYLEAYTLEVQHDDYVLPASIILYDGVCRAYNRYGDGLKLSNSDCKRLLANPHLIPKIKHTTQNTPNQGQIEASNQTAEPKSMIAKYKPHDIQENIKDNVQSGIKIDVEQ